MGKQDETFLKGEGNAYHRRNLGKAKNCYILDCLEPLRLGPLSALEVGCGDGSNIAEIAHHYGCVAEGTDPSMEAIYAASTAYEGITFLVGKATELPNRHYDLLVYGFCLYLCDRDDLPLIVFEGDRALNDKGHLAIHDFDPDYPHKVPYRHAPGIFSYKMDYSKLWLANPAYTLVSKTQLRDGTAVWVLKKDIDAGWPLEELK